jgi:hypothetical protein
MLANLPFSIQILNLSVLLRSISYFNIRYIIVNLFDTNTISLVDTPGYSYLLGPFWLTPDTISSTILLSSMITVNAMFFSKYKPSCAGQSLNTTSVKYTRSVQPRITNRCSFSPQRFEVLVPIHIMLVLARPYYDLTMSKTSAQVLHVRTMASLPLS